jgi:hypothetical protein
MLQPAGVAGALWQSAAVQPGLARLQLLPRPGPQVLAVLTGSPGWSTAQLLSSGMGRAAAALGAVLLLLSIQGAWHQLAPAWRGHRCAAGLRASQRCDP